MNYFWASVSFVAICSMQLTSSEDIGCFVHGECVQSPYVQDWSVVDAQECLELCQKFDGCEYFTHYGLDDYCLGFSDCVELSQGSCQECYSGNTSCPDLQCWVRGSCYGVFVSQEHVGTDTECLEACRNDLACTWFTYNDADGACLLLQGCDDFSTEDCDTCWSSQRQCGERKDMTKIMVVAGWGYYAGYRDEVDIIDLTSEIQSCLSPSSYPFPGIYMVGTLIGGVPVVCGGSTESGVVTNECYQYNHDNNNWAPTSQNMLEYRSKSKASLVDSTTWLISGGYGETGISVDSTEIYYDGTFSYGPLLPSARSSHCQVTINSSHIAILGGYNGTDSLQDFYLLDWEHQDFIQMPDVPVALYADPCGLIENSDNGQELVVLSNYDSCHIFNFRDQTWRNNGPVITDGITLDSYEMVAQMEKNFYILGAWLGDRTTDAVYEFDAENYQWVRQSFSLPMPYDAGVAIPVPDEVVFCP